MPSTGRSAPLRIHRVSDQDVVADAQFGGSLRKLAVAAAAVDDRELGSRLPQRPQGEQEGVGVLLRSDPATKSAIEPLVGSPSEALKDDDD